MLLWLLNLDFAGGSAAGGGGQALRRPTLFAKKPLATPERVPATTRSVLRDTARAAFALAFDEVVLKSVVDRHLLEQSVYIKSWSPLRVAEDLIRLHMLFVDSSATILPALEAVDRFHAGVYLHEDAYVYAPPQTTTGLVRWDTAGQLAELERFAQMLSQLPGNERVVEELRWLMKARDGIHN